MLLAGAPAGLEHDAWGMLVQDMALSHALQGMETGTGLGSALLLAQTWRIPCASHPNDICPTAVASKLEVSMPAVVEVESGGTARIECNFYIPGNGSYTYINWFYVSAGPQRGPWLVGWGAS